MRALLPTTIVSSFAIALSRFNVRIDAISMSVVCFIVNFCFQMIDMRVRAPIRARSVSLMDHFHLEVRRFSVAA